MYSLKKMEQYFQPDIEPEFIELPGRGSRFGDKLETDINKIVEDSHKQIGTKLNTPYAFYGHSMGAYILYLLTLKIRDEKIYNEPLQIFTSGCSGPSLPRHKFISDLPLNDFLNELKQMDGTPPAFFKTPELWDVFIPVLRADFAAIEKYTYVKPSEKLNIPITIINGDAETIASSSLEKWQDETVLPLKKYILKGGHFFIFDNFPEICRIISDNLTQKQH